MLSDSGRCDFCGKDRRSVQALVAMERELHICNECIGLCHQILAVEEPARSGAPPKDENASDENKLRAIYLRMGKDEQPGDEATYDRLRPTVWGGRRWPPLTYDGFRCSVCDAHRREVDLINGPHRSICQTCLAGAAAAISRA